jgi:hypothetical protein
MTTELANGATAQNAASSFDLQKFFKSYFKIGEIPEGYDYYLVEGRGVHLTDSSCYCTDYTAVIAAPDKDHARALAQFEFITFENSRASSLQELKAEIERITYDWRSDHTYPQYDGWAKVDFLKFRCIENTKQITKAKANSLKKRGDVEGNVYRPEK